ncbi:Cupredoxin [Aspergillus fruticulosus]
MHIFSVLSISLSSFTALTCTKSHNFDWNITWVTANPDGLQPHPVIGINNEWPLPLLNFTKGDRVSANVHNGLGNQSMSIDQSCTYWYHSHTKGQYPDGWRQALIVHAEDDPYIGQYDQEYVITLSDWYHNQMPPLLKEFISPGMTYLFRLANIGAFASQYFWIEDHEMQIVEVDGVWTEPATADRIYISSAQRYSFLVTMKDETSRNYAMVGSMDTVCHKPALFPAQKKPAPADVTDLDYFDDYTLVPYDAVEALPDADMAITLDLTMDNLGDGANYAFFNGISYVSPKVPVLYSALITGSAASNATVYGTDTNAYVLEKVDIVDIVLNNDDTRKHPFHLHGHNFRVLWRSGDYEGHFNKDNVTFASVPVCWDTLIVSPMGNFVVRFKADNPGVWFFHCHIEWHMNAGLAAVMVEAPLYLQEHLTILQNHYDVCAAAGTPTEGNAAGNTEDFFDLAGENKAVAPLPAGFTARGILALVFSCVAAFLGLASIVWSVSLFRC